MSTDELSPETVLAEWNTGNIEDLVQLGVEAAKAGQYERGLIFLAEAYRHLSHDRHRLSGPLLTSYGLCLALHRGRIKEAAEFCWLGVERDRYNPDAYHNMARVWIAGRSRRKALDAIEKGLAVEPRHGALLRLQAEIGVRKRPVIPFLHRDNPLNVSLGRARAKMNAQKAVGPGKGNPRSSRPTR